MTHIKASPSPALTAQRPRRTRIRIAGFFGAFLLLQVFALGVVARQYLGDPTRDNLTIVVVTGLPVFMWILLLVVQLVPKVEFFDHHLISRSLWGLSRKRSYQEIDKLEMKYGHLLVAFKHRGDIALSRSEINIEDLAGWLGERIQLQSESRGQATTFETERE